MTAPSYRLNVISVFLFSVFLIIFFSVSVSAQVPGVSFGGGEYAAPPPSSTPATPESGSNIDRNFGTGAAHGDYCRRIRRRLLAGEPNPKDKADYDVCSLQLIQYCTKLGSGSRGKSAQITKGCYKDLMGFKDCSQSSSGSPSGGGAEAQAKACNDENRTICMRQASPLLNDKCLSAAGIAPRPSEPGGGEPGGGDGEGGSDPTDPATDEPGAPTDEGENAEHPLTKQHSVCDKGEGSEDDGQLTEKVIKDGEHAGETELGCARKLEQDKCAQAAFGPLKDLTCSDPDGGLEGNSIVKMLKLAVQVTAVGVGIIITGVLATAGIQYASARGNPQAIAGAKTKILAALGGLAIYLLFATLVNFLIPGGIIG